ncbi:MAG: hypothetical protein RH917_05185 [Lacipirellulaceae bacterium]
MDSATERNTLSTDGGLPRSQRAEVTITRFDLPRRFSVRIASWTVEFLWLTLTQGTTTLTGARDGRALGYVM